MSRALPSSCLVSRKGRVATLIRLGWDECWTGPLGLSSWRLRIEKTPANTRLNCNRGYELLDHYHEGATLGLGPTMPVLFTLALAFLPLHWAAWACKCSIHTYKAPAFSHPLHFMPWGWLEHLVETSANCTPNVKLSTKNLRCFYTATVAENVTSLVWIDASDFF